VNCVLQKLRLLVAVKQSSSCWVRNVLSSLLPLPLPLLNKPLLYVLLVRKRLVRLGPPVVVVSVAIAATVVSEVIAQSAASVQAAVVDRSNLMAKLRVKYVKSSIGYPKDQKATIQALGFRKLQQTVEHEDHPTIRGMIRKVNHLVQVEEVISETL
jgi:large subunit ribosomal protein L30